MGSIQFWRQLLRNISPKLGAMIQRMPKSSLVASNEDQFHHKKERIYLQAPCGMLSRRSASEVLSRRNDDHGFVVRWTVKDEVESLASVNENLLCPGSRSLS
jgi:hypothetical protein